jgi:group I intron endonuclease
MKDSNKIVPIKTYNASKDKSLIYTENKNKSGIYRWNNKVTNKSYVGSSLNLDRRLSIYYSKKAMLAKVKTRTSIIYSALLKYGYGNFTLDILEYCDVDILIEREQYYLDLLEPEYNILKAANSRIGSKHSLKTRALMSIKLKGINHPFYGKKTSYETRKRIGESLKSSLIFNNSVKLRSKFTTNETILKKSLKSDGVSVKIYNKLGNLVKIFPSTNKAAKYFGVSSNTIRRIPNKGIYDNFTFEFNINDTRVWVYDVNKELIRIFKNTKEVSEWCNISRNTLCSYIRSGKLYYDKLYFYKINSKLNPLFINDNYNRIVPHIIYRNLEKDKYLIFTENKGKSGVYRLNNLATGKSYIGSSINLADKLTIYYSKETMLNKVSTRPNIIYSELLKYGYVNFSLDIFEYCEIYVLENREQYYIDILKPEYNPKIVNLYLGRKQKDINNRKRLSLERRMQISESIKAYRLRVKFKPYVRKPETLLKLSLRTVGVIVKIFDKKGNLVNTFPTISNAAKYFGVSNNTISCIPNKGVFDNFIFEFELNDTRVWVYDVNKELVKVFNSTKEVAEWCNISRNPLNGYIRSGKLYKKKDLYFYNIKSKPSQWVDNGGYSNDDN